MMKRKISTFLLILAVVMIYSCQQKQNSKNVTIAYVNWAEGVAMTKLSKAILEKEGYTVELKNADVAPVFAAVAGGDADIFMDTWMPITHKDYMEKYGENLEVLGINFENARIGFVVPEYVDINSIDELNANAALFKGKIVGIDAGAGIMSKAEMAIKDYKLKFELQSASEAAMLAVLKKSVDANEPVIITGWAPHYIFSTYKLKFLDDPKGVFGSVETIQTIANKKFAASNPEVKAFFSNFQMDDTELGSLMAALENDDNEANAVGNWMSSHDAFVVKMTAFLKPAL